LAPIIASRWPFGRAAHTLRSRRPTIADPPGQETFDSAFLSELEGLVAGSGIKVSSVAQGGEGARSYRETLAAFLAPLAAGGPPLNELAFLELAPVPLAERCNALIDSSRRSPRRDAAQAAESFVVFFQALVPTLGPEAAREVKATFFRLVPTLIQMAWLEMGEGGELRRETRETLALLETVLLEVSSVRLAPVESGTLFKSLDQLATLIAAGEWALARDVVVAPLLEILRKNRAKRPLFRLMEVEMALQAYLRERLGHDTPHLRIPDDLDELADFGPLRVFDEEGEGGTRQRFLQVQLPDIPVLSDVVIHLQAAGGEDYKLRLDGLGSVRIDLKAGLYQIGLLYEPEASRG
jgi:hypothetical protein